MSKIVIRAAKPSDIKALIPLMKEMEDHYQKQNAIGIDQIETCLKAWFEETSDSVMLIAERGDDFDGHAIISPLFPAGDLSTAYFLKDIFVGARARGAGLGAALIEACAKETLKRNGSRLDLTVDSYNDAAAALYKRLGAVDTQKSYLRWEGDALADLAQNAKTTD